VRLCGLTRVWRIDPGGPTVVGLIAGRWVLFNGQYAEVGGQEQKRATLPA
jgi:hypothetical protein